MVSEKQPVTLQGVLRGQGKEATCTVSAVKVFLPGTNEFTYTDYDITSVSMQLPDAQYQLTVHGETISVKLENGFWFASPQAVFVKVAPQRRIRRFQPQTLPTTSI